VQARREVDDLFKEMRANAEAHPAVLSNYEQVEVALICFVDFVIATLPGDLGAEWHEKRLAYELPSQVATGDQHFFELLEPTLQDRSEQGTVRLGIFYRCMGLGMTGAYSGQPEFLRRKMQECYTRLRSTGDANATRICPESYEHVDERDLIEKPPRSLWAMGMVLVCMIILLVIANFVLYQDSVGALRDHLKALTVSQNIR